VQALLALSALLLAPVQEKLPIPESSAEDFFILNFSEDPREQVSLLDFARLTEEATGLHFTYEPEIQARLGSIKVVLPGLLRVPKTRFSGFARFQFFVRGFGWFEGEPARTSPVTIRPVPSSLVRVAFPPAELVYGFDEQEHPEPVVFAQPAGTKLSGVVLRRPEAAQGYTLVTGLSKAEAILIDLQGTELRRWTDPEGCRGHWDQATLLRNGDLLCLDPWNETLLRLGFDGHSVWRLSLAVHHEATELPDGRILVLARRLRVIPAIDPSRRSVDHLVAVVSGDGRVLEEHSLYDLLQKEPVVLPVARPRELENLPPDYGVDPMHASSLSWLESPGAQEKNPLLRSGRVLVTFRNLDSVALVDLAEGRCVGAWGKGVLHHPHDASFREDGSLLVLEDGDDPRLGARVLELDPLTEHVRWEYRAPFPGAFPSSGRGTIQPLEEGHVLVGSSNLAEAFELTRSGEPAWRYVSSSRPVPGVLGIQRVEHYEPGFIDPLLASVQAPR